MVKEVTEEEMGNKPTLPHTFPSILIRMNEHATVEDIEQMVNDAVELNLDSKGYRSNLQEVYEFV